MSTNPTALDVLAILDETASHLVEPDWEWSTIGDNNLLAWEATARVARVTGLPKSECFPEVCRSLRRRWQERFHSEGQQ